MKCSLSPQGYSIYKSELSFEDLDALKNELTVQANIPLDFGNQNKPFRLYQEGPNKIYIPKFYGISKFGDPQIMKIYNGETINVDFIGGLRKEQEEPISKFLSTCSHPYKSGGLLNLTCASGKCLGRDTPVLMYDGSIKLVQEIVVGDQLMGDDSRPRNVLSTCHGKECMYKVHQYNRNSYIVNSSHILSLKYEGKVIDINIQDYLSHKHKDKMMGYSVPIHFKEKEIDIDPYTIGYFYGAYQGDKLVKINKKLHTYFMQSSFSYSQNNNDMYINLDDNILLKDYLDKYNLETIPLNYRANTRNTMLEFLAGVIDACALCTGIEYIITKKSTTFMNDFTYMCKSIGLGIHKKNNKVFVYGNLINIIPSKLHYISPTIKTLNTLEYPIDVEKLSDDDYYGFEIDGNRRFLLGDFTVTHNTVMAIYLICKISVKSLVVVHKDFLLEQWKERIQQFAPSAKIGLIKAKTIDVDNKDIVLASLQSLSMKDYDPEIFKGFGFAIVDECHHTSAEVFSKALKKINFRYTLGLSATIKRKDGLSKVFKWYLGDVIYSNVKKKNNDVVHIDCRHYYVPDPSYSKEVYMMGKKLNISKMINNVCEYQPRVEFITDCIVNTLEKEPGRKIIVLSDRRGHLELIGKELKKHNLQYGFYFGGMKQDDLKESETKKILLGTFCMVSEGFDCKSLDTLLLASPKSDIVQSVGRILREEAKNRKYTPLVIDIIDQFSIFERQANKRLKYYKSQKYVILGEDKADIKDNKVVKLEGPCFRDIE